VREGTSDTPTGQYRQAGMGTAYYSGRGHVAIGDQALIRKELSKSRFDLRDCYEGGKNNEVRTVDQNEVRKA
jgi:hypothetical protein